MNKTMNEQKHFWQKLPQSTTWILWLLMVLSTLSGQGDKRLDSNAKTTLADEQLISIVKKHEALLGQYAEDPSRFGKRELSTRVQNVIAAYTAFNNDNSDDVFGYVLHGKFLREIGRFEEAYNMFQKANKLDPNIAIVKQQLGNFLAESGRYKEAYPLFVSAVKLDPEKAIYQYQLGAHLIYFGKQLQAEKQISPKDFDQQLSSSLSEAVRLAPENRTYKHLYAESFYDLNKPNWQMALKIWTELLGPDASKMQTEAIQLQRARVLSFLDKKEEAKKLLEQVTHPSLATTKRKLQARLDVKSSISTPAKKPPIGTVKPAVTPVNQSLQREVDQLRKELADLKNKKSPPLKVSPSPPSIPVKTHNKALTDLNNNLKQLDGDKKKLLRELEASRRQIITQEKSIQKKEQTTKVLQTELETAQKKLEIANNQLSVPKPKSIPLVQHNQAIQAIENILSTAQEDKGSLELEVKAIKAELAKGRRIKNDLKQAHAERNAAKADLQKHLEAADNAKKQFFQEKQSLVSQVDILQKKTKEEANKMAAGLQKALSAEKGQTEILEKNKAKQTQEIQFLNKELSNLESKLLSLLDTKSKAERQQGTDIKQHLATIDSLKNQIDAKEKMQTELISSMAEKARGDLELRQKLQKLSQQNQSYQSLTDLLEGVVEDLSTGTIDLVDSVASLDNRGIKELEQSETNKQRFLTEVEKLQSLKQFTKKNTEEKMEKAESTISHLEKELNSIRTKNIDLSNELSKSQNATKSLHANVDQVEKDNLRLATELEQELAQGQSLKSKANTMALAMAKERKMTEALEKDLKKYAGVVNVRDNAIASLQKELSAAKVLTASHSKEISNRTDLMEVMRKDGELQSKETNRLKTERDQLKDKNTTLTQGLESTVAKVGTLEDQIKGLKEIILESKTTNSALSEQFLEDENVTLDLVDWALTLSDKITQAESQNGVSKLQAEERYKQLQDNTQKQTAELANKLKNAQTILIERDRAIATLQRDINATQVATKNLSKEIINGKDAMEKLLAHAQAQSKENAQLKTERDQIKNQNNNLAQQTKVAAEKVTSLETQIKEREEATLGNQRTYSTLKNQILDREAISMDLVDWAISLSDELANSKGQETLIQIEKQNFEDKLHAQTEIAKTKAGETKSLRVELNKVRTILSQEEQKARNTRQSMSIQIKSAKEREATLQNSLESVLALKSATEKKWQTSQDAQVLLNEKIQSQEAKIAIRVADQKEISELADTIKDQKSVIEEANILNQTISAQLKISKVKLSDQAESIASYQAESKTADDQIENSRDWVEMLVAGLEDNINQTTLREEKQASQIKELQNRVLTQANQKGKNDSLELEKAKAMIQIAKEKAEEQIKHTQDARDSNKTLTEQIDLLQAAKKKNQKVAEALTQEISVLKTQGEKLAAGIEKKNKALGDQNKKQSAREKEILVQLNRAKEQQEAETKQIQTLQSTLEKTRQELDVRRKDSPVNNDEELVATLEGWIDALTQEITQQGLGEPSDEVALRRIIAANLVTAETLEKELQAGIDAAKIAKLELASVNKERKSIQAELDLTKKSGSKLDEENQSLEQKVSAMEARLKAGHIASMKPLQAKLFVAKEKNHSLNKKLSEEEKETKFLSAELNSLESNLLKALKKQTDDEKKAAREIQNLQKQLGQTQETIAALKSSQLSKQPNKGTMAELEKQAALNNLYEKQIKELRASYKRLEDDTSEVEKKLHKQLEGTQFQLKTVNNDKQAQSKLAKNKSREIVTLNSRLNDLEKKLTSANVPKNQRMQDLENKLKLSTDSSNSLRNRIQGLGEEKIEIAEKLILTEGNLARAKKQLSTMQGSVDKLAKYLPGQPIKKQLEAVKSELASYRKDTASRMMKLTKVESNLIETKQALVDKEEDSISLAKSYKNKLGEIVNSSKQLQNALAQTRKELSKARDEKNQTLVELAEQYAKMKNNVHQLQNELDATRKQSATRSTANKERELLAEALDRLRKSENTILLLRQNLAESHSQNTRISVSYTILLDKLKGLQQVNIQPVSNPVSVESKQKITQLEEALQLSKTKLESRDQQFENVVARMNLILERLHASPAVRTP